MSQIIEKSYTNKEKEKSDVILRTSIHSLIRERDSAFYRGFTIGIIATTLVIGLISAAYLAQEEDCIKLPFYFNVIVPGNGTPIEIINNSVFDNVYDADWSTYSEYPEPSLSWNTTLCRFIFDDYNQKKGIAKGEIICPKNAEQIQQTIIKNHSNISFTQRDGEVCQMELNPDAEKTGNMSGCMRCPSGKWKSNITFKDFPLCKPQGIISITNLSINYSTQNLTELNLSELKSYLNHGRIYPNEG
jgi:hypothetical protein